MTLDIIDAEMLAQRRTLRDRCQGPRTGDFIRMADGKLRRISGGTRSQPWKGEQYRGAILAREFREGYCGSCYLTNGGTAYYNGGNDFCGATLEFRDTGETVEGTFWFFHHHVKDAANRVEFTLPCRLFAEVTST